MCPVYRYIPHSINRRWTVHSIRARAIAGGMLLRTMRFPSGTVYLRRITVFTDCGHALVHPCAVPTWLLHVKAPRTHRFSGGFPSYVRLCTVLWWRRWRSYRASSYHDHVDSPVACREFDRIPTTAAVKYVGLPLKE